MRRARATKAPAEFDSLRAEKELDREFPNWRELTGAPTEYRPYINTSTPFRKWLELQSTDYQKKVNFAWSSLPVKLAIESFMAETAVK